MFYRGQSCGLTVSLAAMGIIACGISVAQDELPSLVIDNRDAGATAIGDWKVSARPDHYGADSLYSGIGYAEFRFSSGAQLPKGTYKVFAWWTSYYQRGGRVRIGAPLTGASTFVNQFDPSLSGQWNYLFDVACNPVCEVVIYDPFGPPQASADAVKFEAVRLSESDPWPLTSCPCDPYINRGLDVYVSSGGSLDVWMDDASQRLGRRCETFREPGALPRAYLYRPSSFAGIIEISTFTASSSGTLSCSVSVRGRGIEPAYAVEAFPILQDYSGDDVASSEIAEACVASIMNICQNWILE